MSVPWMLCLFLFVQDTNGCAKVIFLRDGIIHDKGNTDTSALLSAIPGTETQNKCAAKCGMTHGCLSLFCDKGTGECQLYSSLIKSSDPSLESQPGYVYFRPRCPIIVEDYVPNGITKVSYSGGNWVATVTCDTTAIFVGSSKSVMCDADGYWPPMGNCNLVQWTYPSIPILESIPFAVNIGSMVVFYGASFGTQFVVELLAGDDIGLKIKLTSDGQVERSSTVISVVQGLTSTASTAFYKPPKEFKCNIEIAEKAFVVTTSEGTLFQYEHIVPFSSIGKFGFTGDVQLKQVKLFQ